MAGPAARPASLGGLSSPAEPDLLKRVDLRIKAADHQPDLGVPPFREWLTPEGEVWTLFFRLDDHYHLRFPRLADFELSMDGKVVTAYALPGVSRGTLDHLFLNQALPLALSRQGQLVLHGSAVALGRAPDSRAVAFLANSGRGKSTLAASFAAQGNAFLTDDGLQLLWQDGKCLAQPSHPSIRLWADSRAAVVSGPAEQAPAVDYTDKARLLAGPALPHCAHAMILARVYHLGDGTAQDVCIRPMSPAQACVALAQHAFLLDFQEQSNLAWQFDEIARLAGLPIHFELDYPRSFERLPEVRAAIEAHARAESVPLTP